MNEIPKNLYEKFDFNWSVCAVEHIDGMDKNMNFLIDNLNTLKSGGIAIHTSEFNLSSDLDTCFDPEYFIFRNQDVEKVITKLNALGHEVYPMNFKVGISLADNFVDIPTFVKNNVDLRLELRGVVSTSFGLLARKRETFSIL
jgi:hypothetical protein